MFAGVAHATWVAYERIADLKDVSAPFTGRAHASGRHCRFKQAMLFFWAPAVLADYEYLLHAFAFACALMALRNVDGSNPHR